MVVARHSGLAFILTALAVLLTGTGLIAGDGPEQALTFSHAPTNPAFLDHQVHGAGTETFTADGHRTGFVPPPVDLSHLKKGHQSLIGGTGVLPFRYDLRRGTRLPPVRDQGACGSCWAFAAYGSLESNLRPSEIWDFSENNMKNTHGFDYGYCDGGDSFMAMAYLTRWSGPWTESDDPYNPNNGTSPPFDATRVVKHIQQALILPDRENPLDNSLIKEAVIGYGPLFTSMYMDTSNYYNSAYRSYFYPDMKPSNHAVVIIGWDDSFDRNKFIIPAPGDGAFIVRNSWGAGWGALGYFYVSYYDNRIGTYNTVFTNGESTSNFDRVYRYDHFGWVASGGFGNNEYAWFGNIWEAVEDGSLAAVGIYVPGAGAAYDLRVYKGPFSGSSPINGEPVATLSGTLSHAGYHTLLLDEAVTVAKFESFSVVVKLNTPGYRYPVVIEYLKSGYTSNTQPIDPGLSWISSNGAAWIDTMTMTDTPNMKVSLKAFTGEPCTYSLKPSARQVGARGDVFFVNFMAEGNLCGLPPVLSDSGWIAATMNGYDKKKGTGRIRVTVFETNSSQPRNGTLHVGDGALSIVQNGKLCNLDQLIPSGLGMDRGGGQEKFSVGLSATSPSDCRWTAKSDSSWLQVLSFDGEGEGDVDFSVASNGSGRSRTGRITVTLTQTPTIKRNFVLQQGK